MMSPTVLGMTLLSRLIAYNANVIYGKKVAEDFQQPFL